jgi:hypothetical protein
MKTKLTKEELASIKDFEVGKTYKSKEGLEYKVLEVTPKQVICQLRNRTVKFPKFLYAGVYAAIKFGKPLFLSTKITRMSEDEDS